VIISSPMEKELVCTSLRDLLQVQPGNRSSSEFTGQVSAYHIVIRIRVRRFSLPWRGAFRGTVMSRKNGTIIIGKLDSNWSLYFVGYPLLAAVLINIALNGLSGHGFGRLAELAIFLAGAFFVCGYLSWIDASDTRSITEAICRVSQGRVEHGALEF